MLQVWHFPILALLLSTSSDQVATPCAASQEPCVLTLAGDDGPNASASCLSEDWKRHLTFHQQHRFQDRNRDGAWEAVVSLDLQPQWGCTCIRFEIEFDSEISRWLVHVGDSVTNDGYGGSKEGETEGNCAEVSLEATGKRDARMMVEGVYSGVQGEALDEQPLRLTHLPVREARLDLIACDQSLEFLLSDPTSGQPGLSGILRFRTHTVLFTLDGQPDRHPGGPNPIDYELHAAFNRVIHDATGAPNHDRYGKGVKLVRIVLTP